MRLSAFTLMDGLKLFTFLCYPSFYISDFLNALNVAIGDLIIECNRDIKKRGLKILILILQELYRFLSLFVLLLKLPILLINIL